MRSLLVLIIHLLLIKPVYGQLEGKKWKIESFQLIASDTITLYHIDSTTTRWPWLKSFSVEYFGDHTYQSTNTSNTIDVGNWAFVDNTGLTIDGDTIKFRLVSPSRIQYIGSVQTYNQLQELVTATTLTTLFGEETCSDPVSIRSGLWDDPTIWSCGRIPTVNDRVTIKHQVLVSSNYEAKAFNVLYTSSGQLELKPGAQLVLSQ
jgi:hypothetical protein